LERWNFIKKINWFGLDFKKFFINNQHT